MDLHDDTHEHGIFLAQGLQYPSSTGWLLLAYNERDLLWSSLYQCAEIQELRGGCACPYSGLNM